jgi:hypothetical protein
MPAATGPRGPTAVCAWTTWLKPSNIANAERLTFAFSQFEPLRRRDAPDEAISYAIRTDVYLTNASNGESADKRQQ